MMYLEMARDETHGGGAWGFSNCVWSPTEKERGGGTWPFWAKILDIRTGDVVLHLRGKPPHAHFVGYSIAASDGFETSKRPPDPGKWSYSEKFYRADLIGFVPFHTPINLDAVFSAKRRELEEYFDLNKSMASQKLNIFFVRQSGRLQCQNGAYLSDVDEKLFSILFDEPYEDGHLGESRSPVSVETGSQLSMVKTRVGQAVFAREIKKLFGNKCCFPGCEIADPRFLVASHIARWSDNERLRGHLGNGLLLCVMHDRAFELGLFTLDQNFKIFLNPKEVGVADSVSGALRAHEGHQIKLGSVRPLDDALLEHWIRVDIDP